MCHFNKFGVLTVAERTNERLSELNIIKNLKAGNTSLRVIRAPDQNKSLPPLMSRQRRKSPDSAKGELESTALSEATEAYQKVTK